MSSSSAASAHRTWSPAQERLFWREGRRRVAERGQGMQLRPGYVDRFWQAEQTAMQEQNAVNNSPVNASPNYSPNHYPNLDSRPETNAHIRLVQSILTKVLVSLAMRSRDHDQSKLCSPEVEHFDRATARLAGVSYGSPEYKAFLAELRPALDHHYALNSHHPEHYPDGIRGMNLLDMVEMLCDWLAASQRHADGDIRRSIEINQARFGYSDELKQIFLNTLPLLEG